MGVVSAPATRSDEGPGGSEGLGLTLPLPAPASCPACGERPACFSLPCPHHAGPCPPPSVLQLVVWGRMHNGHSCVHEHGHPLSAAARGGQLGCGAQPSPKPQKAMSTGSVRLNSAWRPQGPWASRQAPKGSFFQLPPCHPDPSTSSISFHCPGSAAWLPLPPP